jgi:NAD(P)-dependent dehydrogenase (short-subunit alcohol dehydrogenase family)
MTDLSNYAAAVTGGSRGIGYAIAEHLARQNMDVSICARTSSDLQEAASELYEAGGGNVHCVQADVSDLSDCETFVEETIDVFGQLDILVNNAGLGTFSSVEDMDPEEWNQVLDVNLTGSFYMTREALPALKESDRTGYVFFLSSLAGKNTFEGASAYCASKFGLNALAECLMLEERQNGIKVHSIAPGSVHTDFSDEDKSEWALHPEDIGKTVVDLLNNRTEAHTSYVEMRPFQPPE